LLKYFLKELLSFPFGQLLQGLSGLVFGSRGTAGISGLERAAASFCGQG
jgi:hypothetical protein